MSMHEYLYPGRGEPEPQVTGPQQGQITKITGAGAFFKLDAFDSKHEFGPAPWPQMTYHAHDEVGIHTHQSDPPPVGAKCLVLFTGPGIAGPWVVGWWA